MQQVDFQSREKAKAKAQAAKGESCDIELDDTFDFKAEGNKLNKLIAHLAQKK